jgi:hypothetical protein
VRLLPLQHSVKTTVTAAALIDTAYKYTRIQLYTQIPSSDAPGDVRSAACEALLHGWAHAAVRLAQPSDRWLHHAVAGRMHELFNEATAVSRSSSGSSSSISAAAAAAAAAAGSSAAAAAAGGSGTEGAQAAAWRRMEAVIHLDSALGGTSLHPPHYEAYLLEATEKGVTALSRTKAPLLLAMLEACVHKDAVRAALRLCMTTLQQSLDGEDQQQQQQGDTPTGDAPGGSELAGAGAPPPALNTQVCLIVQ